jgi:hypothetical protein
VNDSTDFDLGHGVTGAWLVNGRGEIVGIIEEHDHVEIVDGVSQPSRRSMGSVPFRGSSLDDGVAWDITAGVAGKWDGLTLSPSIQCRTCPNHGHIVNGAWVPA